MKAICLPTKALAACLALAIALSMASCASSGSGKGKVPSFAAEYGLDFPDEYGMGPIEEGPVETPAPEEPRRTPPSGAPLVVPPLPAIACTSSFYAENAPKIARRRLSNGIDLTVYRDPGRPTAVLRILVKGGSALSNPDKPGAESMLLELCAMGGQALSAKDWKAMLYRNAASVFHDADNDACALNLSVPAVNFSECLGPFLDAFLNPALRQEDFDAALRDRLSYLRSRDGNGTNIDVILRARAFYGHPYALSPDGDPSLSQAVSLVDLRALHWELGAERISVVAVGDIDPDWLVGRLNEGLGTLDRLGDAPPPPPRWASDCDLYTKNIGTARESWIAGAFAAPGPSDAEWPAFRVATTVLSKLLFQIVRLREGQAYGIGAGVNADLSPWGVIHVSNSAHPARIKAWINEAVGLLAEGMAPASSGTPGSTEPLASSIETWKRLCVSQAYLGSEGALNVARGLSDALLSTGDPEEHFRQVDRIMAVTADEVVSVVRRWILPARVSWVIAGGQMAFSTIEPDEWISFETASKGAAAEEGTKAALEVDGE